MFRVHTPDLNSPKYITDGYLEKTSSNCDVRHLHFKTSSIQALPRFHISRLHKQKKQCHSKYFEQNNLRTKNTQDLVKVEKFCFRNLDFYFWHGESISAASQLSCPGSKKSKIKNKKGRESPEPPIIFFVKWSSHQVQRVDTYPTYHINEF